MFPYLSFHCYQTLCSLPSLKMMSLLSLSLLATTVASFALGTRYERPPVVFPIKLTWEKGAPDGFERDMIFMNGQFPGPTLNLEEGDNVEVR